MSKFLALTKILLINGGNPFESGFENKKKKGMTIFVMLCFAPLIIQNTMVLISSYDMIAKMHMEGAIMSGALAGGSLAMVLFGIFYAISIYYFSGDVETLLALPFKPYQILGAKFVIVLFYEYFIEILFIFPVFLAYGLKMGTILYWIYSIFIFLLLPIIPVVICSLISMVIMTFTKFVRDKDRFKTIAGVLGIVLALGLNVVIMKFADIGSNEQIQQTIQSNSAAINGSTNIFPSVKLATYTLLYSNSFKAIAYLLLFAIISLGAILLILAFAEGLYLKGAIGISQTSSKGKKLTAKELDKASHQSSKLTAYTIKELKLLFRTPAYFLNCVLGGLIFPVIMIIVFMISGDGLSAFAIGTDTSMFLAISTGIIILLCSFNMITPTAISREGSNLYVCKYIPISYKDQIMAKMLSGAIISYISMITIMLANVFIFSIKPLMIIFILIISTLGIFAVSFIGILIDLNFPKLDWDNETKAVKQNFNVGIDMIITVLIALAFGFLAAKMKMTVTSTFLFLTAAYGILCIILYRIVITTGVRLFSGNGKAANVSESKSRSNKARMKNIFIALSIIIPIAFVGILLMYENQVKTVVAVNENNITVKAGLGESCSYNTRDIKEVYMKDTLPKTRKKNGYNSGYTRRGLFKVEGLGTGNIYIDNNKGPYLYIIFKEKFIIINYKDPVETQKVYDEVVKYK